MRKIRKIKAVTCSHYNRGSRIQDRAATFAAGHPRGRRINPKNSTKYNTKLGNKTKFA